MDVADDMLAGLSADRPVLLVCLRHLGCAFSREALADLQAQRAAIEANGARLVIAHLETKAVAAPILERYGLGDVAAMSDPSAAVYETYGLERGRAGQLIGLHVLWRWLTVALLRGHGAGWTGADVRRMPGIFLIDRGKIARAFRHETTSDRPDYIDFSRPLSRSG
jgi:hypothetical protein